VKRVVKIGGRAQSSPDLVSRIAEAWKAAPNSFCVVHGGGDEISAMQRRAGSEPSFVDGRRITTREDIEIVRMVLSGLVNKRLVSHLVAAGVPAVGISGEDAGTIAATPIDADGLGRAGKPVSVNADLIQTLLDAGYLPVISPLAGEDGGLPGEALNVNGDDAAAAIAIAIGGAELLLVADVAGVLDGSGVPIVSLDPTKASGLIQSGVINRGMRAKLEAGFAALAGGVGRVRISTLSGLNDPAGGTQLALAQSLIT
jgi:acetylglutamate kinase